MKKVLANYRVKLVREGEYTYSSKIKKITSPSIALTVVEEQFKGMDREKFLILMLNITYEVIGLNTVSIGTLDSTLVHPREVFKPAILTNSAQIILFHNHPGASLTPSREDRKITRRLVEAGKILGIKVLDHLIINDDQYYSFKDHGFCFFE